MTGKRARRTGSGVKIVQRTLADGTVREYRYDPEARRAAAARAENAHALHRLAVAFQTSPEFRRLSPSWQAAVRFYLAIVEDKLGWMTFTDLDDRSARGDFYELRDEYAATPAKADKLMNVLRRLLEWAYDRGRIGVNHAVRIERLVPRGQSRHEHVWSEEHEAALLLKARPEIADLFRLALLTGLRQHDLCRLRWSQLDADGWLTVTPAKTERSTGAEVHVPTFAFPPLADLVAGLSRATEFILTTDQARPWSPENLKTRFRKACATAGLADADLTFHDIRGTTSSRLLAAGCTDAEVDTVLGHALGGRTALRHYAARSRELALSAYRKWTAATAPPTVLEFPGKRTKNTV